MPRIKLLQAGYVRGNAQVGSTHVVSQAEADLLVDSRVAIFDESETIQLTEIERLQSEMLSLSGQLQRVQDERDAAVARADKYDTLDEHARNLAATVRDRETEISGLKEEVANLDTQLNQKEDELQALQAEVDSLRSAQPTELPADFPGRDELIAAGHTTVEAVKALTEAQLNGVPGIGEATIKKIREYQATPQG